jgi:hypothetical protein
MLLNQVNEDGGSSGESIGLVIRVEDSVNDDQVNNNNKNKQQQQQQETVVVLTLPVDNVSDFLQQYQLQPRQRQPQQQPLSNSNPPLDAVTAGGLSFRRANIHPQPAAAAAVPNYNYYYQQRPPYYYYNQESLFPLAQFYRQFYGLP